jgi:hypothetical protein
MPYVQQNMESSVSFSLESFCQKVRLKLKFWKRSVFLGGFHLPEVRKKRSRNNHIYIFGFQCVAKNIEG